MDFEIVEGQRKNSVLYVADGKGYVKDKEFPKKILYFVPTK